jgi:CRP/FNR family transcriptional regulator, cyclic AMP receptor protein
LYDAADYKRAMEEHQTRNFILNPRQLRRLKIFADMSEEQLSVFANIVEPLEVTPNRIIVKSNDAGDCMYLLLDGEVRVSQFVEGRETVLATLETGDFFGEISLFDQGPRTADVVAIRDCKLLKITKQAFYGILEENPDTAARFLLGIIRTVAGRLRKLDRKYGDSMLLSRYWSQGAAPQAKRGLG